ncbi:MAG: N-6 DNA methylase [Lentisphaerae bacterium RIFOXYB12_FULL_65_16]|nr:MAG: N-6 DNA methylase [Lentisphaerae bacterium RIFOXYA12_64_32]OGV87627.1 MAG: N-6 DNA methylase [Lentisphaerae bacterium RIFOXYB12_FULL_65_16]
MPNIQLIATAAFGLEAVVVRELHRLGYTDTRVQAGRIAFSGDPAAICRTNLWLRAADRVLLELGRFHAADFDALFDQTRALPWHEWIPPNGRFPVRGRSIKSQLSSVPACQKTVKKAMVEHLRKAHRVAQLPETGPEFSVEVALLDNEATLTIDTSGLGLHKRGYRDRSAEAPLKETLAAGMIQLSVWNRERPLLDPFCGSGTIPIEAALIARNAAPGRNREFAAEEWLCLPARLWEAARREADELLDRTPLAPLLGSDRDAQVLGLARRHAEQAGVADAIRFEQRHFSDVRSPHEFGCLIANPPYGERLGGVDEVEALYRAMPDVFSRFPTWSFYVITALPGFERLVRRPADKRRKLYNGRIECTYYQFLGPPPARAGDREERPIVPAFAPPGK